MQPVVPSEPFTFVLALAAIIANATVAILTFRQTRQTHVLVNSRMTQLLKAVGVSSHHEGELAGRDFVRKEFRDATDATEQRASDERIARER